VKPVYSLEKQRHGPRISGQRYSLRPSSFLRNERDGARLFVLQMRLLFLWYLFLLIQCRLGRSNLNQRSNIYTYLAPPRPRCLSQATQCLHSTPRLPQELGPQEAVAKGSRLFESPSNAEVLRGSQRAKRLVFV